MGDLQFNIHMVHENFKKSLCEENDVTLEEYLTSYEELNKFFSLMGSLFTFVSQDLQAKINILKELLNKDRENFNSALKMINYEKANELLAKKDYVSGSRTLLRLHRGLDFIRLFLRKLYDLEDSDYTGGVCREVYDTTLAQHHTFLIVAGARLAMKYLPTKIHLFTTVCNNDDAFMRASLEILPETLETIEQVYNRIQHFYTEHDLHSLP